MATNLTDLFSVDALADALGQEETSKVLDTPEAVSDPPGSEALRVNTLRGSEISPEQEATDRQTAEKAQIPRGAIADSTRKQAEEQARMREVDQATQNTPVTRDFFSLDELAATLAGDEAPHLARMERAAKETSNIRFGAGIDTLQQLGYRFVEATGEITGAEGLARFGTAGAAEQARELKIAGPKIRIKDVSSASDLWDWMVQNGSEQAPLMAPSLATGAAGAGAGFLVAGPPGALVGGLIGAFIPSFVLGTGETQQAVKERDPTTKAGALVFGSGALIGALDSLLPGKVGGKLVKALGVEAAEKAIKLSATKIAQRAAAAGGRGMLLEGITEAVQEAISESAAALATDTEIDVADLADQMVEAFAVGTLLGFGVSTTSSASGDVIKARKIKKTLDTMNQLKQDSKLNTRAADKSAELATEDLLAAGVDSVFVPAEALLNFANQHPEGVAAAFVQLDVSNLISDALSSGEAVEIAVDKFSRTVLGSEGYKILAPHLKLSREEKSLHEAAEAVFAEEGAQEELVEALEKHDATLDLEERVAALIGKVKPGIAAEVLDAAAPDEHAVLMDLIQRVEEGKKDVSETVKEGRAAQLDEEIAPLDEQITSAQDEIEKRELENVGLPSSKQAPTVALENKVASLSAKRDVLVDEQVELTLPDQKAGLLEEFEESIVTPPEKGATKEKAIRKKKIKTKASVLQDLAVSITRESVRAVRAGFRAGLKVGKDLVTSKKAVIKAVGKMAGLTDTNKLSLTRRVNAAKTTEGFKKVVDAVQSRAVILIERNRVAQLKSAIIKTLKKQRPKLDSSGRLIGKLTPEISESIAKLKAIFDMAPETAEANLITLAENPSDDPTEAVEALALSAVAHPDLVRSNELEALLLDLNDIIAGGRAINKRNAYAKAQQVFELQERLINAIDPVTGEELVLDEETGEEKIVETRKGREGGKPQSLFEQAETALLGQSGAWWTKLKRIMRSSDTKEVNSLLEELRLFDESRVYNRNREDTITKAFDALIEAYGVADTVVAGKVVHTARSKMLSLLQSQETEQIDFGALLHSDGLHKPVSMTRAELIQRMAELQNDKVRETLFHAKGNQYTQDVVDALSNAMTTEDQAALKAIIKFYGELYPRIDKVYAKNHGIHLPRVDNYVPIRKAGDSHETPELLKNILFRGNVSNASLKSRTDAHRKLEPRSAWVTLETHVGQMEYYIAYHDKVQLLNRVFNAQINGTITELYGSGMSDSIKSDLEYFARMGTLASTAGEQLFVGLMRNFSIAQLGVKPQIAVKQLMSFVALSQGVRSVDFIAGLADFTAHPKKALKLLNRSEYFRQRGGLTMDNDFKDATGRQFGGGKIDKLLNVLGRNPTLARVLTLNIRVGDKGAIAIGGYGHIFGMIKKGKREGLSQKEAEAQAVRSFELKASDTQQSSDPDQISQFQRGNPFVRILTQFMSSANALTRAQYDAIVDFRRGRTSAAEFSKSIFLYHFLIPTMIQFTANIFQWDWEDQKRAAIYGSLNGLLIFGDLVEGTVNYFTDSENIYPLETRHPLRVFTDLIEAIGDLVEESDNIGFEDFLDATAGVDKAMKSASGASGVPFSTLHGIFVKGPRHLIKGDIGIGLAYIAGYSKFSIEKNLD